MQLGKTGTPSGLIATSAFQGLAVSELGALGVAGLPLLVVEHPLGGERPEAIARRARQAVEQLASLIDRKSTRLNSSHSQISYAVFCLKKKKPCKRDVLDQDTV